MEFHNKGYGKTVELLRPLIDKTPTKSNAEHKERISTQHWTTVADLNAALNYFESDLPVCVLGFSPYEVRSIHEESVKEHRLKIIVSCMPGFEFEGPRTETFKQEYQCGTGVEMTFRQPNFSDCTEELGRYTCGLTVSNFKEALSAVKNDTKVCAVIDGHDVEIIRVRQEPPDDLLSIDNPSPVMIEIADVWSEREFEIFRYE